MFRAIGKRLKEAGAFLLNSRLIMLLILFFACFAVLVGRLFYLQIIKGEDYLENYELSIQRTTEISATRGNIYDRNGNLLAYNKLANAVTIDLSTLENTLDDSEDEDAAINAILDEIITIVEENGDSVITSFGIILDSSGEYEFSQSSETQRLRFVADVYGQTSADDLTDEQKEQSAEEIIHYLCTDSTYGYGLDDETLDREYILKMVNMRYAMSLNSYQQYISTTLASDVSDETVAAIMENRDDLIGVDIEEESIRVYEDAEYFASIIGYTGQISQEEYDALDEDVKDNYSLSDIVGKSGLEQALDSILQGTKGETTMYVDNMGRVLETVSLTEPEAGNDVYLTIDMDLQETAYDLLEQKIAGIVLSKLRNVLEYDSSSVEDASDLIIPVSDAYYNFIANQLIDADHFGSEDAGEAEQQIYAIFTEKQESVIEKVMADLENENAASQGSLSDERADYMEYVYDDVLSDNGILLTDQIDTEDETYIAWAEEESISLYTFLNYAISQNWVDVSELGESSYSSSAEVYQLMLDYVEECLYSDTDFDYLIYQYLITSGKVSGRLLCAVFYEQGVLEEDEETYEGLMDGTIGPYSWLTGKIESLEITPGDLALEPCSGGVVISDPNTGEVLACVSYPGYDNNLLANDMDTEYYVKLNTGLSNVFYNHATQEKTAPGSTFKMVSAVAGLTEGVIDADFEVYCTGEYTRVDPNPKCWSYPSGHGSLDVVGAIQNSCNYFFYSVGYQLSLDEDENYNSEAGLAILQEYAEMFGLGETTGIEISESSPQISDTDSVRSAIGQGTNNYTVSQLNRYVAAVANGGTVYSLSLVDKTTDSNGNLIKDYESEVVNELDTVSDETWDLVHEGMERVVTHSSTFKGTDVDMAGKTGTAQVSTQHPDNGLFVGYAPTEDPEIAIAIRITNGYSSSNAAAVARDIVQIYFDESLKDELITGTAADTETTSTGD